MGTIEAWKDVDGFEGLYKVSDMGRVLDVKTGKIRGLVKDKYGYFQLGLTKDGKRTFHKVHRLVAIAFIENPNSLSDVNHKNEIKMDNRPDNLEWCTRAYNNAYGTRKFRDGKKVLQRRLDGTAVAEYRSIRDAGRCNNIDPKSIYRWCVKNGGVGHGYKWYFEVT